MMKLVLIRHGESEWNKLNLFTGWMDADLSERGRMQARRAGQTLKAGDYDFDICYTSFLKRAIHTLNNVLDEMDRNWLPVVKTWKLNERHYGELQGLSWNDAIAKYGEETIQNWRRSFDMKPPALAPEDERSAKKAVMYHDVDPTLLPDTESLMETIARVVAFFNESIKPEMEAGKRVLISAHANMLLALRMYFDNLTQEAIPGISIPNAIPLVYEFDDAFHAASHYYLADPETLK